jgi:hypothetical protein
MADGKSRARALASAIRGTGGSPLALWSAFAGVHLWLVALNLFGPGLPLGDVTLIYPFWIERGLLDGVWVGITSDWVYPIVALIPMLVAYLVGPDAYAYTWLALVSALNAGALALLVGTRPRVRHAAVAWWWLLFLLALGPIALGRIDSVTAPFAIAAVSLLARHPRAAGALLAVGAWIKVWPAALLLAALVALGARVRVALGALIVSLVVVASALSLGAGWRLLSPITQQTGRGLQIEAPLTAPWLWAAWAERWSAHVYYDNEILTWQVFGDRSEQAAAAATPLLALTVLVILLLAALAVVNGAIETRLVPPVALALVMALIVVNKVGSPQFVSWIAAPIMLGLLWSRRGGIGFRVPAVLTLIIAGLTQYVYPFHYGETLGLQTLALVVLTARNVLELALLVWSVCAIVRLSREAGASTDVRVRVERDSIEHLIEDKETHS